MSNVQFYEYFGLIHKLNNMSGPVDMQHNRIRNLAPPKYGPDAVNKDYVDSLVANSIATSTAALNESGVINNLYYNSTVNDIWTVSQIGPFELHWKRTGKIVNLNFAPPGASGNQTNSSNIIQSNDLAASGLPPPAATYQGFRRAKQVVPIRNNNVVTVGIIQLELLFDELRITCFPTDSTPWTSTGAPPDTVLGAEVYQGHLSFTYFTD